jgi:hypothetical protein
MVLCQIKSFNLKEYRVFLSQMRNCWQTFVAGGRDSLAIGVPEAQEGLGEIDSLKSTAIF